MKYQYRLIINQLYCVALFTRAWIEIERATKIHDKLVGRPLHEGVD